MYKLTHFAVVRIHIMNVPKTRNTFRKKFFETYALYFKFGMENINSIYLTPRETGAAYKRSNDITARKK
jgi:hypothetical protein